MTTRKQPTLRDAVEDLQALANRLLALEQRNAAIGIQYQHTPLGRKNVESVLEPLTDAIDAETSKLIGRPLNCDIREVLKLLDSLAWRTGARLNTKALPPRKVKVWTNDEGLYDAVRSPSSVQPHYSHHLVTEGLKFNEWGELVSVDGQKYRGPSPKDEDEEE